ncbi:MAG: RNA polymerase sigma factor RpoH [Francisellaceae bacterium]
MGKELVVKKNTLPIPALSDSQSLESYMRFVNSIPMLSEKEELELARRLRYQNDLASAQKMIMAHLRFVVKVARGFSGYGLPITDLIQEGNIGLMKAVRRYDPEVGVRLVSFAVHWIKAEMHEYVLKNWRIVKIATTKPQRKLFFNLRSSKQRLGWMSDEEITDVAHELGVSKEVVIEMEKRMNAYDMAFDAPVDEADGDAAFAPSMYLEDSNSNPELLVEESQFDEKIKEKMQAVIGKFDERSRDIIVSRWLVDDKKTLHELAEKYSISAERVRQIEEESLAKLKTALVKL